MGRAVAARCGTRTAGALLGSGAVGTPGAAGQESAPWAGTPTEAQAGAEHRTRKLVCGDAEVEPVAFRPRTTLSAIRFFTRTRQGGASRMLQASSRSVHPTLCGNLLSIVPVESRGQGQPDAMARHELRDADIDERQAGIPGPETDAHATAPR